MDIENFLEKKWQWKHDNSKPMGCSKGSSKREAYSNASYLRKQGKHWIDNLNWLLKKLIKKNNRKIAKISTWKGIIKIWTEINEKETKETIVKINKTKSWFFEKINKIDKPLARLIKKKREKKSTKLEMEKERLQQIMQK